MPLQLTSASSFVTEKLHRPSQNSTDVIVGPVLAKLSGLTSDYRHYHGASDTNKNPSPVTSPIRHKDAAHAHDDEKRGERRLATRIGMIEENYERSQDAREGTYMTSSCIA